MPAFVGHDRLGLLFDLPDLIECGVVEITRKHERARRLDKPLAQLEVARARPCFDERLALPRLRVAAVILERPLQADRQRARPPVRTQPHVDPEQVAFRRLLAHQLDDVLAELVKIIQRAGRAGRAAGRFGLVGVQEQQVDVRTEIEFAPAEFAQPDHGEPDVARLARRFPQNRLAVSQFEVAQPNPDSRLERRVRQVGQILGQRRQRDVYKHLARRDPQDLPLPVLPHDPAAPLDRVAAFHPLHHLGGHFVTGPGVVELRLVRQPRDVLGPAAHDVRQEMALVEQGRQQARVSDVAAKPRGHGIRRVGRIEEPFERHQHHVRFRRFRQGAGNMCGKTRTASLQQAGQPPARQLGVVKGY
jgi:hypothetical protein